MKGQEIARGTKVIKPYRREPANARSLEGSLYTSGYSFIPGTSRKFYPRVDSRGVIRTGLDENAMKLRAIEDLEVREQEVQRIKTLKTYYESILDESLEPTSTFYDEIKENGYTLEDTDNVFNLENPRDAVNFFWLMETEMIASSMDDIESGKADGSIVRFYVHDGEIESKVAFERKKKINSAIAALDKMTSVKRKKIQKLLGLGLPADASEEEVYNALDEYLRLPATALSQDPIASFIKIHSYSEETLAIKSLIRELIDYNVVRVKGSIVYEGEHVWAKSVEEFELVLADPKNADVFSAFKDKIKNKMKLSVL
jgi:hypothetical protein